MSAFDNSALIKIFNVKEMIKDFMRLHYYSYRLGSSATALQLVRSILMPLIHDEYRDSQLHT